MLGLGLPYVAMSWSTIGVGGTGWSGLESVVDVRIENVKYGVAKFRSGLVVVVVSRVSCCDGEQFLL